MVLTHGRTSCAATGDIDEMWIRDSAVQVAIYMPAARRDPALRGVLEGIIFRQAFYILQARDDALRCHTACCHDDCASSLAGDCRHRPPLHYHNY